MPWVSRATCAAVFAVSAIAHADDARVDWAAGMVIADGVGVADRHAPNPAVARGPSRRKAEAAAKQAIAKALPGLPLAGGGKLGDKLDDAAVKARIDRALDFAITLDAQPETDGAWQITMGLPLEAVRQALDGPRKLEAAGDTGRQVVVITGVSAKPALGYTVGGIAGATLWVKSVPAWARDAPKAKASSAKAGAIDAKLGDAGPATLFVVTP
ncbi:MAG: hypothetical protein AB7O24_20640 [Kofleriaceae bacterium]